MNKFISLLVLCTVAATLAGPISGADDLGSTKPGSINPLATEVEAFNHAGERRSSLLIRQGKYDDALALLLPLSEAGDAESQTQLGSLYEKGLGVPLDMDVAIRWYQHAAAKDYPRAQVNLGVLYQYGSGVARDLAAAIFWYKKAVAKKDPRAAGKLAYLYLTERGFENDAKEAVRLLERSAAGGYNEAQFNLAMLLLRGERGVAIDSSRAIHLLQRAVKQDNPQAMNMLALLYSLDDIKRPSYLRDINLPKDSVLAHHLLERAAALGYGAARDNLAKLCRQAPDLCEPDN